MVELSLRQQMQEQSLTCPVDRQNLDPDRVYITVLFLKLNE